MILIAHNIRSLHNVGAILRSADAFGVEKVYLTGYTGKPPRKEIAKVALGAEHRIDWEGKEDVCDLLRLLKTEGFELLALDNVHGAVPIHRHTPSAKVALIVGNEVEGLENEVLDSVDVTLEIPMPGQKQSLNVSVATGIALFAIGSSTR